MLEHLPPDMSRADVVVRRYGESLAITVHGWTATHGFGAGAPLLTLSAPGSLTAQLVVDQCSGAVQTIIGSARMWLEDVTRVTTPHRLSLELRLSPRLAALLAGSILFDPETFGTFEEVNEGGLTRLVFPSSYAARTHHRISHITVARDFYGASLVTH